MKTSVTVSRPAGAGRIARILRRLHERTELLARERHWRRQTSGVAVTGPPPARDEDTREEAV